MALRGDFPPPPLDFSRLFEYGLKDIKGEFKHLARTANVESILHGFEVHKRLESDVSGQFELYVKSLMINCRKKMKCKPRLGLNVTTECALSLNIEFETY